MNLYSVPYKELGRDRRTGLDCMGFLIAFYADSFNDPSIIPDPLKVANVGKEIRKLAESVFMTVEEPDFGDVVLMPGTKTVNHLGMVVFDGVIHCADHMGVVVLPANAVNILGFMRLKKLC